MKKQPGTTGGQQENTTMGGFMEQIEKSKKFQNGIQVFWSGADNSMDFFTYDELVEQRINALDLLNNPGIYLINPADHRLESSV